MVDSLQSTRQETLQAQINYHLSRANQNQQVEKVSLISEDMAAHLSQLNSRQNETNSILQKILDQNMQINGSLSAHNHLLQTQLEKLIQINQTYTQMLLTQSQRRPSVLAPQDGSANVQMLGSPSKRQRTEVQPTGPQNIQGITNLMPRFLINISNNHQGSGSL